MADNGVWTQADETYLDYAMAASPPGMENRLQTILHLFPLNKRNVAQLRYLEKVALEDMNAFAQHQIHPQENPELLQIQHPPPPQMQEMVPDQQNHPPQMQEMELVQNLNPQMLQVQHDHPPQMQQGCCN
ncbi:hypothetical protein A2U01_0012178 [Trifolium medium]|uniref:Uncharacterized protein n=1 Tax=Trifolium medium TaxID=97028 RepID=A0A392MVD2_9FABA|nr:hypothetical protein [Trifolium medium]